MNAAQARLVLGAVALVGALELVASAHVYGDSMAAEDWRQVADAVAALPADDDVALATAWLGPRARLEIPRLAAPHAVAPPDLRGVARLHVLGLGEAWSPELTALLEGAPAPALQTSTAVGPFTLATYDLGSAPPLADWTASSATLSVQTPAGRCRGSGSSYRCNEGNVSVELAEVDYRPRRCLALTVGDGVPVRISQARMPLGQQLRGHVGFSDYNRRLRNDTPARVVVRIDDAEVGRFVVTDEQGWRSFVVPTAEGAAAVELEVTVGVRGTWGKAGLQPGLPRVVCLELRSLEDAP